jgi:hypothetical protein
MAMVQRVVAMLVGAALAAAALSAGSAFAQSTGSGEVKRTPFNYVIKDGKPVPKGNRVTNPDGSWREEIRQGKCVTVKERTAAGEYKETRRCD